jgi:hypothetical protein
LKATGGEGGDVVVSWDNLNLLKHTMGKVDLEGGDGGDALIRGLSEAAEK